MGSSQELTAAERVLCGGIAGITSRLAIAPLDVIKIRLQVVPRRPPSPSPSPHPLTRRPSTRASACARHPQTQAHSHAHGHVTPIKYTGVLSAARCILHEEGVLVRAMRVTRLPPARPAPFPPSPAPKHAQSAHSR